MDPQEAQQKAAHIMLFMMPIFALIGIAFYVLIIIPLWKICTKAGLSGPISLLSLIPGIGLLIALYVIAFMEWRVVRVAPQYGALPPQYPPPPSYPPQGPPAQY